MAASPFVVIWFGLAVLGLCGLAADVLALRAGGGRVIPWIAIGIKAIVALAFAGYFVALWLGAFTGWQDLTTFASILVVSLVSLTVALVLDVIVVVRLARGSQQ